MQNSRAKAATTFPKNKAKLEPQTELCGFIYICNTHTQRQTLDLWHDRLLGDVYRQRFKRDAQFDCNFAFIWGPVWPVCMRVCVQINIENHVQKNISTKIFVRKTAFFLIIYRKIRKKKKLQSEKLRVTTFAKY